MTRSKKESTFKRVWNAFGHGFLIMVALYATLVAADLTASRVVIWEQERKAQADADQFQTWLKAEAGKAGINAPLPNGPGSNQGVPQSADE